MAVQCQNRGNDDIHPKSSRAYESVLGTLLWIYTKERGNDGCKNKLREHDYAMTFSYRYHKLISLCIFILMVVILISFIQQRYYEHTKIKFRNQKDPSSARTRLTRKITIWGLLIAPRF